MQWSDVTRPPSTRVLRQFAALWLVCFLALAAVRWYGGKQGAATVVMGSAAVLIGVPGLILPAVMRPIYTGWMIAVFPIGWTVARIVLSAVFYVVVTPIGLLFRMLGRDVLHRRRASRSTYWTEKPQARAAADYLRQY